MMMIRPRFIILVFFLILILSPTSSADNFTVYFDETVEFESMGYQSYVISVDERINQSGYSVLLNGTDIIGGKFNLVVLYNESYPISDDYNNYNGISPGTIFIREDLESVLEIAEFENLIVGISCPCYGRDYFTTPSNDLNQSIDDPLKFRIIIYYSGNDYGRIRITANLSNSTLAILDGSDNNDTSTTSSNSDDINSQDIDKGFLDGNPLQMFTLPVIILVLLKSRRRMSKN